MKKITIIILLLLIFFVASQLFSEESIEDDLILPENGEDDLILPENGEEEETETPSKKLAIVIDDLGNNYERDLGFSSFDYNLTFAVLPYRESSLKSAEFFQNIDRFEVIFHLPLEPLDEIHYEEEMIFTDMSKEEVALKFENAYQDAGGNFSGINNHKGSKFTSDEESMRYLLEEIKKKEMYFLDSFTTHTSLGYSLAQDMGVNSCKRDVFLDYQDDEKDIKEKLYQAANIALEKGEAIAIGHSKEKTLNVLLQESETIAKMGIEFVLLSDVCK
jgi:uncharacterized protein